LLLFLAPCVFIGQPSQSFAKLGFTGLDRGQLPGQRIARRRQFLAPGFGSPILFHQFLLALQDFGVGFVKLLPLLLQREVVDLQAGLFVFECFFARGQFATMLLGRFVFGMNLCRQLRQAGAVVLKTSPTRGQALCRAKQFGAARENLFAPAASDAQCLATLDAVELAGRVGDAGGLDGWITQDTLSLGEAQRLNLARAMLSPLPVVLLDEPTEHLDAEQSRRIIDRLLAHFGDRILLFSSHERDLSWLSGKVELVRLQPRSDGIKQGE
jgi:hypothetical protein